MMMMMIIVIARLPNDWGEVCPCGWQVKLCDPLVTHGPCRTSVVVVLRDSLLCGTEQFGPTASTSSLFRV